MADYAKPADRLQRSFCRQRCYVYVGRRMSHRLLIGRCHK